jgi:hypothetical protein
VIHGSRATYIRHGCRCDACTIANTNYNRKNRHNLRAENAANAIGFPVPCCRCGIWRHLHQRPSPAKIWVCWHRPCFDCRDGNGARSDMVEQAALDGRSRRNLRLSNRQMLTGGASRSPLRELL